MENVSRIPRPFKRKSPCESAPEELATLKYFDFLLDEASDPQKQCCSRCFTSGLYYDCRLDVLPRMWFLHGYKIPLANLQAQQAAELKLQQRGFMDDNPKIEMRNTAVNKWNLEQLNAFISLHGQDVTAWNFLKVFPESPRAHHWVHASMVLSSALDPFLAPVVVHIIAGYFDGGTHNYLHIVTESVQIHSTHDRVDIDQEVHSRWRAFLAQFKNTSVAASKQYRKFKNKKIISQHYLPRQWNAFPDESRSYQLPEVSMRMQYDIPQYGHRDVYRWSRSRKVAERNVVVCQTCIKEVANPQTLGKRRNILFDQTLFQHDNESLYRDFALDWIRDYFHPRSRARGMASSIDDRVP